MINFINTTLPFLVTLTLPTDIALLSSLLYLPVLLLLLQSVEYFSSPTMSDISKFPSQFPFPHLYPLSPDYTNTYSRPLRFPLIYLIDTLPPAFSTVLLISGFLKMFPLHLIYTYKSIQCLFTSSHSSSQHCIKNLLVSKYSRVSTSSNNSYNSIYLHIFLYRRKSYK